MATVEKDRFGLVALGAVGVAGALLNLSIVPELAQAAGYSQEASWLYWFILDGLAVISMRGSFRARTDRVRQWSTAVSLIALGLSAAAAGAHVFIEGQALPKAIAFVVLCLPVVMIALSLHLVLQMALEAREVADEPPAVEPTEGQQVQAEIEIVERVTERRQVTSSRRTSKSAAFIEALKAVDPPDSLTATAIVDQINPTLPEPLHDASARKLVALYRRGEV